MAHVVTSAYLHGPQNAIESFCGSPFWDKQVTWNTTDPDFTDCFHKTALVWIPCGFLWLFAPLETYYLLKSTCRNIPWTSLNICKIVVAVLLSILVLTEMCYSVHQHVSLGYNVPSVQYYAPFIKLVTFLLAIAFILVGRVKGIQSSGVLFLFWTLLTICGGFTYASQIKQALNEGSIQDETEFALYMLYYPLVVAEFVLALMADARPKYRENYPIDDEKQSPEQSSSFLSKLLFWWFKDLALLGWRRPLERSDLWNLNYEDQLANVLPRFDKYWREEVIKKQRYERSVSFSSQRRDDVTIVEGGRKKSSPTVLVPLVKAFGPIFFFGSIFKFGHDILQFVSPQILKLLIGFTSSNDPLWKGIFYSFLLFIAASLQSVMLGVYFHRMFIVGMRVRSSLISAIYRKALLLSNAARRESTVGEIVNLMSVDAQRFLDLIPFVNLVWSAPFQISLALYFLWIELGPSVLAGLAVMLLMIPVNGVIASYTKKLQVSQMKMKDERVKLMNEILNGIKVLKLYAWEKSFEDQVLDIRQNEVRNLRKMAYLNAVGAFLWTCTPFLVSLASFTLYILVDETNILTAPKAFVSLTLFNILRFPLTMLPNLITQLVMVALASFATYVLVNEDGVLNAGRAFVSLSLFHILRFPLSMLPMLITLMVQTSVSLKRINKFMGSEELDHYISRDHAESSSIVIEDGTFTWTKSESPVLKNITMAIPKGSLTAIVGQVGAGKSSLLAAILGDMEKVEGRVCVKGSIAYVAQQAWIQNATLRDNILFANPLQEERYQKVVEACALKSDLDILPGGDFTEIGEKGINLSGGQKQRVSLARAAYSDADNYLLDDPLSAVDSHVGKHIFDQVIGPNGILKGKTRVLVTHGLSFLPQVDNIIVLKEGTIQEMGSYKELLNKKGAFAEFLVQFLAEEGSDEAVGEDLDLVEEIIQKVGSPEIERQLSRRLSSADSSSDAERKQILRTISRTLSSGSSTSGSMRQLNNLHQSTSSLTRSTSQLKDGKNSVARGGSPVKDGHVVEEKGKGAGTKLVEVEKTETGEVKLAVYIQYLKAVSYLWLLGIVLGFIGFQAFSVSSNIWLSNWSNDKPNPDGSQDLAKRDLRLGVYGALGAGQGLCILLGTFALSFGTMKAATSLHSAMLYNIMRSPTSFFDTTPLGRIINRFSKDIDTIDVTIPQNIRGWLVCALQVLATFFVISFQTVEFLAVILPVGLIYYFIQKFYVATSRQLKRLESVTRSPIYSQFSETLAGVTTIRAYGVQQRFILTSNQQVDLNNTCFYPSIIANRWLAIWLEFCGNCLVLFAALFAVLGRESLSPGIVGLSVSYALSVTATLNWMVRMASELETNIVSVERVMEYCNTPIEAPWDVPENKPDSQWPEKGEVLLDSYSTRYREGLDLVLKDISCRILPGEKVGIVGRTGAGKSSLTLGLFRLIEAAGGSIVIDETDISRIGLHDLRSRITIIPQDPVLFSGSLRMNLDPFNRHSDEEVWKALELAHLKNFVSGLEAGLQHEVTEGGENLSVGQRQLVCLARALLRKTKVLVLDEATAAVDLETDELIQATIRKEFRDSTVLTIAHRLNTIMDYDRVMVLDKGKIIEYNSPSELLKNPKSMFHGLAKDAGLV